MEDESVDEWERGEGWGFFRLTSSDTAYLDCVVRERVKDNVVILLPLYESTLRLIESRGCLLTSESMFKVHTCAPLSK